MCANMSVGSKPNNILAYAREIFSNQPFTAFIGAELQSCSSDGVEIYLSIGDSLKQQHGFVHGGVLSYMADNAVTFAGGIALGGDAVTSEFKINYLRPAQGSALIARARALHAGKRQSVCQCDVFVIFDGVETLCAVAQGTVVSVHS